jgi:hypothetical protein
MFSTTTGVAGLALALAHFRGLVDYDERVAHLLARVRLAGQRRGHRAVVLTE